MGITVMAGLMITIGSGLCTHISSNPGVIATHNWCNATTEHIRARSMFSSGESLLYPVYGMRGGFSLDLDHEVGWMMAQVTLLGWIFRTTVSLWWAGAGERENMVERLHNTSSIGSVDDLLYVR